jgi:hypothetical protein
MIAGYTDIEAATTNSPDSVKAVYFYASGQLVGAATNTPYVASVDFGGKYGTYDFTASLVTTAGETNTSAPVHLTFTVDSPQLFQPWRLPQGEMVCFACVAQPWSIQWSSDLRIWNRGVLSGQLWGNSLMVDETTTNSNVMQRFYWIQNSL